MTPTLTRPVLLHRLAHARSGDKGNRLNIAAIAHEPRFYPLLQELLTSERVKAHFAHRQPGPLPGAEETPQFVEGDA